MGTPTVYQWLKLRRLINYFTPGVCFLCLDKCADQLILCAGCRADLPRSKHGHNRSNLADGSLSTIQISSCSVEIIDRVITSFNYKFPVNKLIHQFKYHQKLTIASALGLELASTVLKVSTSLPDCILPVPLHKLRYFRRGFNQALEIANVVANELGLLVDADILLRTRNTLAQFALIARERNRNLRGAFRLSSIPEYKHVAIIDDVITTGATVNEIARLLKLAGVQRVEAWACASAES